jgi:beta-N-acetylhexosaminidase
MRLLRPSLALSAVALAAAAPATASVSLQRLVGSTVMSALAGPPQASFLARVRAGEVGGVILVGHWQSTARMAQTTRELQSAACERGTPLLIAVDQEGGWARRLPWAAPSETEGELGTGSAAHVEREARAAASALLGAGVDVDFAPVTDTRLAPHSFLGGRAFSSDPSVVGRLAAAFVRGLQAGRVAATAKHFPGLGAATANTDDHAVTVRETRLEPFGSAIRAGARLVMVSNASYPRLDGSGRPAVFSRTIVTGLLRGMLGFKGVVVTDALDAPTPAATPHAAARAIGAGVDLLLYTSGSAADRGYDSLLRDAASSARLRAQVAVASDRIGALKRWLGRRC